MPWWTKGASSASSPRACMQAMRAHVPVPHGERSSAPVHVAGSSDSWSVAMTIALRPSMPGAGDGPVIMTRLIESISGLRGCFTGYCRFTASFRRDPIDCSAGTSAGARPTPRSSARASTKNCPPKATSTGTMRVCPHCAPGSTRGSTGISSGTPRCTANAGTFLIVTARTLPLSQRASTLTSPTAVSSVTVVTGSTIGIRPVSSSAVTVQMVLLPDMGVKAPCSITMIATSARGSEGVSARTAHRPGYPRGSWSTRRRRPCNSRAAYAKRSSIVSPGTSASASTMTRPGSPSAWASMQVRVSAIAPTLALRAHSAWAALSAPARSARNSADAGCRGARTGPALKPRSSRPPLMAAT